MQARIKHRLLLSQMIAAGTFSIALFLGGDGTFAATPERAINLTTYLRDGPGVRYRAVDEAETGTLVSVVGCADGWCNVVDGGVLGYVAQSTLSAPSDQSAPLKNPVCIVGPEASYHGSRDVLYCHSGTASNTKPAAAKP
jgi:uncharacterized protein YraI